MGKLAESIQSYESALKDNDNLNIRKSLEEV